MSGCLDHVECQRPEWCEIGEKRNAVASIAAGILVSILVFICVTCRPQISLFLGHGHFGLDNISFLGARRPCVGAPRPYQGFAEIKHKQGETGVKLFCIFDSSVFFFITELSILIQC